MQTYSFHNWKVNWQEHECLKSHKNLFKEIEPWSPVYSLCVFSFWHNYFRLRFCFSLNGWRPWEEHGSTCPDDPLRCVFWTNVNDFHRFGVIFSSCILGIPFVRAIFYIFQCVSITVKVKRNLFCMLFILFQTTILLGWQDDRNI